MWETVLPSTGSGLEMDLWMSDDHSEEKANMVRQYGPKINSFPKLVID